MKECVAIITARGGSKRIPRKNIRPFLGVPIIKYSIDAALGAGCFTEVMVSTDDEEIAQIARSYGAAVPFMRSAAMANDHTDTASVFIDVIDTYRARGKDFTTLCGIYPTAPFITAQKLADAMALLHSSGVEAVLPVTQFSYPIQRSLKIENEYLYMNWPENYFARSQDLQPMYHDCGQFYCLRSDALRAQRKYLTNITLPFVLPDTEVQDIDTLQDWKIAEIKYQAMRGTLS